MFMKTSNENFNVLIQIAHNVHILNYAHFYKSINIWASLFLIYSNLKYDLMGFRRIR